jgi:hypothetical protein
LITIDCRESENLKHEMAIFVADWLEAIPTLKLHEITLSKFDDRTIDPEAAVKAIKEFFSSIGETSNYEVLQNESNISIKYLHSTQQQKPKTPESMFSCTHCGFVTPYEVLLQNHVRMHYL